MELHNADELSRRLGLETLPPNAYKALVAKAYARWGDSFVSVIEGDYCFVVWDSLRRRLLCCRDRVGVRRLYYFHGKQRFHFADFPLALFSNSDVPRELNRKKLAAAKVSMGHANLSEETFYSGIMSLRPGCTLVVDEAGVRQQTYWEPDIRPELLPRRDDDAFELLRSLMFESVRCRIPASGKVSSLFSGGLDSSAVTALAAKVLADQNRELHAFSAVLPIGVHPELEDERPWVESFEGFPNLRLNFLTAPNRGPFDSIERPDMFQDSFLRGPVAYWADCLENAVFESGGESALTGNLGELSATYPGYGCAVELLSNFRLPSLWRMLREVKRVSGVSPWRFLAGDMLKVANPLRNVRTPIYLNPSFARESSMKKLVKRSWLDHRRTHLNFLKSNLRTHARTGFYRDGGKIQFSWPLFDRRLVEFCLSTPVEMKIRNGYARFLVRKAMQGLMPEKVVHRQGKVLITVDYEARYAAQKKKAQEFVTSIGATDPVRQIVDVQRLVTMIAAPDPKGAILWEIPNTIYLICFLRQFADFRP